MANRQKTAEASLGIPSDEFAQPCGSLRVPYLSLSWKEIRSLDTLGDLSTPELSDLMLTMLRRRVPQLTQEQFEDNCGPADIVPWVNLVQAGPGDSGNG